MRIVYPDAGPGWWSIEAMARLAADLLGASLEVRDGTGRYRGASRAPVPPRRRGDEDVLFIAPTPRHLNELVRDAYRLRAYGRVGVWLIDSFWTDRTPQVGVASRHLDRLYVTDGELVSDWAAIARVETAWLPWGSDVLGTWDERDDERTADLLRLGRQPGTWSNDEQTARAAASAGLVFRPGPPFGASPMESHANVQEALRTTKAVLAFGNSHDRATYTHPTREYVTARWTDALAHGTQVAGIPPRCQATERLLPLEARIPIPADDITAGAEIIREHLHDWTAQRARAIRRTALGAVDWRHRLAIIRDDFELAAPRLDADLDRIATLSP